MIDGLPEYGYMLVPLSPMPMPARVGTPTQLMPKRGPVYWRGKELKNVVSIDTTGYPCRVEVALAFAQKPTGCEASKRFGRLSWSVTSPGGDMVTWTVRKAQAEGNIWIHTTPTDGQYGYLFVSRWRKNQEPNIGIS